MITDNKNIKIPYNKILFTDKQEKEIIKMYTKEKISSVKIGKIFGCSHKVILRLLEKNNIPRTGVGHRIYNINEYYFDKIDTKRKAYILGFLFADGSNCIDKSTISMSLQEDDKQILEDIRNELNSEKPLKYIDYSLKNDFGYSYKNQYQLTFFSKHLCTSLSNLGMIPNKSLKLVFPSIPENLYSHFIRGYFDGDGSITQKIKNDKNRQITVTITSTESFCNSLCEICYEKIGIKAKVYDSSCHNGITKVFVLNGRNIAKTFLDWIYKDADLFLERKYKRYLQYYNLLN